MELTRKEKAKIILENMEKFLQIDWSFEKYYLEGIENGLKEIEKKEKAD